MATRYWKPRTTAVAQVWTGSIDSVDATPSNNTFTVTIGGVAISVAGDTDVATTATNLRAALNDTDAHPYFTAITWSGTSGDIIGTADTAGVPFDAALTETGAGTGTVTDFTETTANASPSDWADAGNWSGETLPGASDDVVIADTSVSVLWRLDGIATIASLTVFQSFTGKIGLDISSFVTSADGETVDATVPEYRDDYLECDIADLVFGRDDGLGQSGIGSSRIKVNNDRAGASLCLVENTADSVPGNKPAIRYLAANGGADVEVLSAPGGFGIAVDVPGETATVGDVTVTDSSTASQVVIGSGTTITNFEQQGGQNRLDSAGTVTAVDVHSGTLEIIGDFQLNNLTIDGGTVTDRHRNTAGTEWLAITVDGGGALTLTDTQEARTVTTLTVKIGGTVEAPWDDLTVTTLAKPTGFASITVAEL